jgi:transposase
VIVTARLPDTRLRVLAMLPDRTKATLVDWLQQIPSAISRQIRTVCTDMWEAYVVAVQETLPKARIVIDRYHIATHDHDCADTLRKQDSSACRKNCQRT